MIYTKEQKRKEYQKTYRQTHKEEAKAYRESRKDKSKKLWKIYYIKNKERISQRKKIYREANKEKILDTNRVYYKTLRGKHSRRRGKHNRRSKDHKVIHLWTEEQYNDKLNSMHGICETCNQWVGKNKLTLDHYYPISKANTGRNYTIEDIGFICKPCNSSKRDNIPENLKEKNIQLLITNF